MRCLFFALVCMPVWTIFPQTSGPKEPDYQAYHQGVLIAETYIAQEQYREALTAYEQVFHEYTFVFLRDYKISAQLALQLGDRQKALGFIKKGIRAGWELKSLKKQRFLSSLKGSPEWEEIDTTYPELHKSYESGLDNSTRTQVHKMFKKDQQKAMGALFRIGDKAQEKYALNRFAPHSEQQLDELLKIIETSGYPGERLIGNDYWASTILSHHNSITKDYVMQDTRYPQMKTLLLEAIRTGAMSPYEYALVDDWYIAVSSERKGTGYGYLRPPARSTLNETNLLRDRIGLRSIELRNQLVEIEGKTGMDFYLPDWVEGAITIEE